MGFVCNWPLSRWRIVPDAPLVSGPTDALPRNGCAWAAHRATPSGIASSIRAIRVRLLASIVSFKCWSPRLIPRYVDCQIRPTVLHQPKCSSMRLRITWLMPLPACREVWPSIVQAP